VIVNAGSAGLFRNLGVREDVDHPELMEFVVAAPRAYWKGHLKLSLVTCPVALFPASSSAEKTHFHQINRKTGHRLRQQMVDEVTGDVVDKDEKGRGYELASGKYVEIEPEELEALELESTRTIDIDKFVPEAEIDKRYYDKPYYIVPDDKSGEEAFAVIRDAMKNKGRVALGRIVFANREHIIAMEAWDKGILGTTLRFDYEIRDDKATFKDIPSPRIPKDMVELAGHILDSKAGHFNPKEFKDKYEDALRKLVKRKASGKTIEAPDREAEPSNVVNLMEALRRSVGETGASKSKTTKAPKAGKKARTKTRRASKKRAA
jgi:DNA end-binding protein Ku